jgi:hypothetical protein
MHMSLFMLPIATWTCSVTLMETSERTNQPTVRRQNLIPYFRPTAWFRSFVCLYCSSIFQECIVFSQFCTVSCLKVMIFLFKY